LTVDDDDATNGLVGNPLPISNAWFASINSNEAVEVSPTGAVLSRVTAGGTPGSIAIAPDGSVWTENKGVGSITKVH
jgi:streptogramin lyase